MMNRVEMNEDVMAQVNGCCCDLGGHFVRPFVQLYNYLNNKNEEKTPEKEIRGPKIPETVALVP